MARNSARPGRTVAAFFIGLAIAYGLVALIGTWKPALGLDLEGGTQITLVADGNVPKDQLNQAADIINARVNGSGVSEAEVTTQGSNEIVVQVPITATSPKAAARTAKNTSTVRPGRALLRAIYCFSSGSAVVSASSFSSSVVPASGVTTRPIAARTTRI